MLRYGESLDLLRRQRDRHIVSSTTISAHLHQRRWPRRVSSTGSTTLLRERRPGIVVIDSFKALRDYADGTASSAGSSTTLAGRLSVLAVTSFWVGEYEREADDAPEFAVADAIIALTVERTAEREARVLPGAQAPGQRLPLRKARLPDLDQGHRGVSHGSPTRSTRRPTSPRRCASPPASPPLDVMLFDGYLQGASTLVAGPSGSGKTLLGLHFLMHGARLGEPGLIATFQENPMQLERMLNGFGWGLERARDRCHVPDAGRSVHRRMGVRPPGRDRAHRREACGDRQPRRPARRRHRRASLPRVHVLTAPATARAGESA